MHQPVGSQVFMMRFDPEATPFESFDEARAAKIVRAGFGCDHRFEVTGIGRWTMSAQVATSYRQGRVLLVGDAAHRFPPTGGLGLNTGVEDVENLLWKLGAVLHGRASDALLDSYEVECRPIARRNTAQSVENAMRMSEVAKAIGADAGDAALAVALQALHDGDATGRFPIIQRAIDDQLKHFAHLQLEMAAAIEAGAFIPSARRVALPVPMVEEHQPSFLPGSYVPHLWLEPGISTIDQLRFDRFVLFAPSDAAAEWRAIATELAGGGYLPVDVVGLDGAMRSEQASAADFWGGEPYAILVRPDGCIAWIEPEDAAADRVRVLSDVLASIAPH